jgi:spermidine synthase
MQARIGMRTDAVFVIFFASGFGGLIYQSIWSHYAKLFLGHAAYAQTLVLVVFIGGLAIGSWICSRMAHRLRNPLRIYALVELAIGIAALLSHKVFVGTIDWSFSTLLPATCSQASTFCVSQWLVTAALLLPQSILLGATFPLVTSAVLRLEADNAGHHISMLYFVNSLGAVLGVLVSAFLLIPRVGLPGTLATAGTINVVLGFAALALSRGIPDEPIAVMPGSAADDAPGAPRLVRILLATAFLTGLSSFIYEIVWIRMLSLVLGASTHSFELMLASFILGLALGGLWIRNRVDILEDPVRFLGFVQLAMGTAAAATIPLYIGSFDLMAWLISSLSHNDGGYVLFSLSSSLIALMVMLPATFCAGMTLPLITYRLLRSREGERALGRVYAINTFGGIAGVLIGVHLLVPYIGLRNALIFAAAIDIALGAYLLVGAVSPEARRRALRGAIPASVCVLAFVAFVVTIDPRISGSGVFRTGAARMSSTVETLYYRDGKTATVSVNGGAGVRSIRTNGKPDAALTMDPSLAPSLDEYTMALLAVLPMGHKPDARTAAVIGFGSGMTTTTLLASQKLERVDTIEIEPAMVEGAQHFRPLVDAAYTDPRSHIVIDDAKSYFARGRERYDILVSEPSNPWVSGVASLFTQEFYARLSGYLNDGGVLAQWLHTYEMDSETLGSILAAVAKTFPDYVIYSSIQGDVVLVARKGGPAGAFDPSVLRLPALQRPLKRLHLDDPEGVQRRWMASSDALGALFGRLGAPTNSDYRPFVEQRTSRTRFTREIVGEFNALSNAPVPMREMLDGQAVPDNARHHPIAAAPIDSAVIEAWKMRDLVVGAADSPTRERPVTELNELNAKVIEQWMRSCSASFGFDQVLLAMVSLAERTAAPLSPEVAGDMWRRIRESSCGRSVVPGQRVWLEMFESTARRDSAGMVKSGSLLLADAPSVKNPATEYAYLATLTGLICRGETAAARKLAGESPRYLKDGSRDTEFHFLEAFAYSPQQRAACLARKG